MWIIQKITRNTLSDTRTWSCSAENVWIWGGWPNKQIAHEWQWGRKLVRAATDNGRRLRTNIAWGLWNMQVGCEVGCEHTGCCCHPANTPTYPPHSPLSFSLSVALIHSFNHRNKERGRTEWQSGQQRLKDEFPSIFCLRLWPSASLAQALLSWG